MPPERIEIDSSVQLLVEGKDAENFFRGFVRRLSLPEIEVRDFGGVDQLRRVLDTNLLGYAHRSAVVGHHSARRAIVRASTSSNRWSQPCPSSVGSGAW